MTTMKKLLSEIESALEAQGFEYDSEHQRAVDVYLDERVGGVANNLGIAPASVLTTYDDLFVPAEIATRVHEMVEEYRASVTARSAVSATISMTDLSRVLMSLGRVPWMVSVNSASLRGKATRLAAEDALDTSASAITMIGMAVKDAAEDGPVESVVISGEYLDHARMAMTITLKMLRTRKWTCGRADLDEGMLVAMGDDLKILSELPVA